MSVKEPFVMSFVVVRLFERVMQTLRVGWPGLDRREGPVVNSKIGRQIT